MSDEQRLAVNDVTTAADDFRRHSTASIDRELITREIVQPKQLCRTLCAALGIRTERVRSISLRVAVDEVPVVVIERLVTKYDVAGFDGLKIETKPIE